MAAPRRALVVGLGIAGMSAAIRLEQAGWVPVIVERSPERRTGGYFIAMFPEGIAAAARLGVDDDIVKRTRHDSVAVQVGRDGTREGGLPGGGGLPGAEAVLRGDIEAGLWKQVEHRIEVRYDTVPTAIAQTPDAATVTLRTGVSGETSEESFDLVVGADGMRSTVRSLVFGPHEQYLKPLDAIICAFQLRRQLPGLAEEEAAIVAEPGRALWVFNLEDTSPTVLFTYRTRDVDAQFTRPAPQVLREVFDDLSAGGLVEAAIAELEAAPHFLFDSVNQVRMPRWHSGRVVLVGDAAWCLTLYSGMGATTGMLGGATLGDKIAEHPDDLPAALAAYDAELRPFVTKHQHLAYPKSHIFVPSSAAVAWIRRRLIRSMGARASRRPAAAGTRAPSSAAA